MVVCRWGIWLLAFSLVVAYACSVPAPTAVQPTPPAPAPVTSPVLKLPEPKLAGGLEEALLKRRSVRDYDSLPLTLAEVSQLLWAAQGITTQQGNRTAPSAGALYPLEVYLVVGNVENLARGIYKYQPDGHGLVKISDSDVRGDLAVAALYQTCVGEAAIDIVITAVYERTTKKYDDRGVRYAHMEAGHAAQNICLQSTALELGSVTVGAFYDDRVKDILGMPENESPLYLIPVGRKKN